MCCLAGQTQAYGILPPAYVLNGCLSSTQARVTSDHIRTPRISEFLVSIGEISSRRTSGFVHSRARVFGLYEKLSSIADTSEWPLHLSPIAHTPYGGIWVSEQAGDMSPMSFTPVPKVFNGTAYRYLRSSGASDMPLHHQDAEQFSRFRMQSVW